MKNIFIVFGVLLFASMAMAQTLSQTDLDKLSADSVDKSLGYQRINIWERTTYFTYLYKFQTVAKNDNGSYDLKMETSFFKIPKKGKTATQISGEAELAASGFHQTKVSEALNMQTKVVPRVTVQDLQAIPSGNIFIDFFAKIAELINAVVANE